MRAGPGGGIHEFEQAAVRRRDLDSKAAATPGKRIIVRGMDRQIQIETSLELWAARIGDPGPRVYARLFARRPEYERLFALDRTGAARGNMLATALDAILDLAGANAWGMNFILAERVNHQGVNVPPAEFSSFLHACLEVLREDLGADWTPDFEGAWGSVLAQIEAACAEDVG